LLLPLYIEIREGGMYHHWSIRPSSSWHQKANERLVKHLAEYGYAPPAISFDTAFGSTRNQSGNCSPIIATECFYCILQLDVFVFSPFTRSFASLMLGSKK
jgi:hypothetical protein